MRYDAIRRELLLYTRELLLYTTDQYKKLSLKIQLNLNINHKITFILKFLAKKR